MNLRQLLKTDADIAFSISGGTNTKLIDPEEGIFDILGLVSLPITERQWRWIIEDINEPMAEGTIFRTWGDKAPGDPETDSAYLCVSDVTDDPTEPDISALKQTDVQGFDKWMEKHIAEGLKGEGRELFQWMSSQLNEAEGVKRLVSTYIVFDQGRKRKCIALRMCVKGRKIAMTGCFDIAQRHVLAAPIIRALNNVKILT